MVDTNILLVDDNQDSCASMSDIFLELGYTVDVAYDGPGALELSGGDTDGQLRFDHGARPSESRLARMVQVALLVELHKRAQHRTTAFEKSERRRRGRLAELMLFAAGKIDDGERRFLHELNAEAQQVSPEFKVLFEESMK